MESSEFFSEIAGGLSAGIGMFYCAENTTPGESVSVPSVRIECHPFPEFMFVVRGSSVFAMNGTEVRVTPGSFCLIPPWMPHQYGYRPGDAGLLHVWFGIHDRRFYFSVIRIGERGEVFSLCRGVLPEVLLPVYSLIEGDSEGRVDGCPERKITFFNLILSETREVLARIVSDDPPPTPKEEIVGALKYFIENRNGADCALATLEKHFGYSRSHLSHIFRDTEKISIGDYIARVRMNYAVAAKKHGFKQKEIAVGLGFSSPSAFWLWQKKHLDGTDGGCGEF